MNRLMTCAALLGVLMVVGCQTTRDPAGKGEEKANRVENRVDYHTDRAIDKAVDRVLY